MFWRRGERDAKDMPYSIVLLTRVPQMFSKADLEMASERAWGKQFDGKEDPMYFVSCSHGVTFLKAGKYVVQLIHSEQPYSDDLEAGAKSLPRAEQKKAWFAHQAWFSLDIWNSAVAERDNISRKEAYAVLARFARTLGDANCCAVYFPKEGWMLPNDGSAEEGLQRLIGKFPLN